MTDRFRMMAEEARQMADKAAKPIDKEFWLRVAEQWNKLIQEADEKTASQGSNSTETRPACLKTASRGRRRATS